MADTTDIRVAIKTLGCKVNRVESEDIAAELLGLGVDLVEEDEAALIVVNTCTVTGEADAKARKAIRHALNAGSAPLVVVTGCLAALDREGLEALSERVIVESDKELVAGRVARALRVAPELPAAEPGQPAPSRTAPGFRTRAPLKIQDGCDSFCSYCIVPYARGVPRSVPLGRVIEAASALIAAGARELVLTGVNLGRYRDAETGGDLADVVVAVAACGAARLRLSSIEPLDLSERLLTALSRTPAVCAHLHVPLQSGSDEVLAAMGRRYTIAQFEERIAAARTALPGLAVTTDVMAGFPGESPDQAQATEQACERIGFSKLHVFRYSERSGTAAAEMLEIVPKGVRAERAAVLRNLGARLQARYSASRVGEPVEVLVESVEGTIAAGTSREYLRVEFPATDGVSVGDVVWVAYQPPA